MDTHLIYKEIRSTILLILREYVKDKDDNWYWNEADILADETIDKINRMLNYEDSKQHTIRQYNKSPNCCGCPSFPYAMCGPCFRYNKL